MTSSEKAVLIDVGFTRKLTTQGSIRLMGDVHPSCREIAQLMTPVPGGIGPLTIAHLCRNTVNAQLYNQNQPLLPLTSFWRCWKYVQFFWKLFFKFYDFLDFFGWLAKCQRNWKERAMTLEMIETRKNQKDLTQTDLIPKYHGPCHSMFIEIRVNFNFCFNK